MVENSDGNNRSLSSLVRKPKSRKRRSREEVEIPVGIEKILYRAARDDAFKEKLLKDRALAVRESGVVLRPSEAGMLNVITGESLSTMIDSIVPSKPKRRRFVSLVAAAAASLAVGTVEVACENSEADGGTGPDIDVDTDTDSESDFDTDKDTDTDTDVDGGPDGSL